MFKSKIDITYEEYDLLAHYFPTLKQKHLFSIRQSFLHQIDPWTNLEDKNEALTIFKNFISEFAALNQKLCNDVLAEKLLLVCILTYGGFEIFPAKYKIIFNRIDVFIDQFRKNNLEAYKSFQELFHKTNTQLKRPFVYQGNQLLFWIEILSPEFFIQSGEIKVKIASDLGLEHQNFYKNIFSDLFTDIKIIENDCKDKADFMITNHFIDEDELPLIFIGDYPSIEDLTNIHKKCCMS